MHELVLVSVLNVANAAAATSVDRTIDYLSRKASCPADLPLAAQLGTGLFS